MIKVQKLLKLHEKGARDFEVIEEKVFSSINEAESFIKYWKNIYFSEGEYDYSFRLVLSGAERVAQLQKEILSLQAELEETKKALKEAEAEAEAEANA